MQNYLINILVSFLFYISIPIAIRYVILRKPIKSKWIAIGILVPIFIGFSIVINIQRDEVQKKIYQELNMPYKSRPHMIGSPILYVAMALSYGILRRRNKNSEARPASNMKLFHRIGTFFISFKKTTRIPNPPSMDAPREEGERWVNDTTSPPANSKKVSNVWSEELLRKYGIITILVGVGILFISIFFSSGYHPKLNFIGNISRMEIVLKERYYTSKKIAASDITEDDWIDIPLDEDEGNWVDIPIDGRVDIPSRVVRSKRVAIPLKYPLSLSVIFILLGTGIVLISKNKKTNV